MEPLQNDNRLYLNPLIFYEFEYEDCTHVFQDVFPFEDALFKAINHDFNPIFHKLTLIDNDPLPCDSHLKDIDPCPNKPLSHNLPNETAFGDRYCEDEILILDHDVFPTSPFFNNYLDVKSSLDDPRDFGDEGLHFDVHFENIIKYFFANTSLTEYSYSPNNDDLRYSEAKYDTFDDEFDYEAPTFLPDPTLTCSLLINILILIHAQPLMNTLLTSMRSHFIRLNSRACLYSQIPCLNHNTIL